ncbi:MAG TPA: amidohydrolase family protein [Pyrinomonadaceae bacterium]|jgi:imidazolonepropionase-like amidohydrolase|nr:amidohydrolase family protein [Pyrinomonadaceae bacterium]
MKLRLLLLAFGAIGSLFSLSAFGQSYAITNAKVVTVSGETIEKGTVVVRDGLIQAVGANVVAPADAQVFDGTGLTVYPGFIDTLTSLGMPAAPARPTGGGPGGGAAAATAAAPTSNSNYPAGLRPEAIAEDDLRGGESQYETNRNAGFTTVLTVGRTGIFNGQSAIIDLAGDNVSGMIIKSPFAEHISFATIQGQYPGSLLGTFSALRQMFLDAQRLQELRKLYAADPKGMKRPEADKSLDALIPILNRQVPIVFNANRFNEIARALDFAKEFNLKIYIAGGQEAWKLTDRLKAQDVPVLLSLNYPKRTATASAEADPEDLDLLRFRAETPKGAAKLAQAGVKFAFQSGGATSIGDYFTNAGKTVEGGLSRDATVRAMTLGAAELLGISDRTGSIEPGKIANLTVVKGDLFGTDRSIKNVFVDGKPFEQKDAPPAERGQGGRRGGRPDGAAPGAPPTTTPAFAEVGGNYNITINVPDQTLTGTLVLVQQAAVITGSLTTQIGTATVRDGKVTAEGFNFASTVEIGGASMEIHVQGKVTGNQISGTIDTPQGVVPFTGTKNP